MNLSLFYVPSTIFYSYWDVTSELWLKYHKFRLMLRRYKSYRRRTPYNTRWNILCVFIKSSKWTVEKNPFIIPVIRITWYLIYIFYDNYILGGIAFTDFWNPPLSNHPLTCPTFENYLEIDVCFYYNIIYQLLKQNFRFNLRSQSIPLSYIWLECLSTHRYVTRCELGARWM